MTKLYTIMMKSHCGAPDVEREVLADSKDEAADLMMDVMDLDKQMILDNMNDGEEMWPTPFEVVGGQMEFIRNSIRKSHGNN